MNPPGPLVAGAAVILTGDWINTALQAVLIANRARRINGLPESTANRGLVEAFAAAMAASGQSDGREPPPLQHYPQTQPTVPIKEAARQLELSERHTRRRATEFGGKIIAGRWLLDQTAIDEHRSN